MSNTDSMGWYFAMRVEHSSYPAMPARCTMPGCVVRYRQGVDRPCSADHAPVVPAVQLAPAEGKAA